MFQSMEEQMAAIGVIPVICLKDIEKSEALARALCDGGLPAAEVTFRAAGAAQVISRMKAACPQMVVGAGTVLTLEQAQEAVDAGAQFIVSPGLDPELVLWCLDRNLPVFPGCVTPSEVLQARKLGLMLVKFFPAEAYGGRNTLKALHGPFGDMRFMPTGGVDLKNLEDYLSVPYIAACGGTFMVKEDLLEKEDWETVRSQSAAAAAIVKKVRERA